eukprot:6214110-Pleurochrysis_carterae.AAC.14
MQPKLVLTKPCMRTWNVLTNAGRPEHHRRHRDPRRFARRGQAPRVVAGSNTDALTVRSAVCATACKTIVQVQSSND